MTRSVVLAATQMRNIDKQTRPDQTGLAGEVISHANHQYL